LGGYEAIAEEVADEVGVGCSTGTPGHGGTEGIEDVDAGEWAVEAASLWF